MCVFGWKRFPEDNRMFGSGNFNSNRLNGEFVKQGIRNPTARIWRPIAFCKIDLWCGGIRSVINLMPWTCVWIALLCTAMHLKEPSKASLVRLAKSYPTTYSNFNSLTSSCANYNRKFGFQTNWFDQTLIDYVKWSITIVDRADQKLESILFLFYQTILPDLVTRFSFLWSSCWRNSSD